MNMAFHRQTGQSRNRESKNNAPTYSVDELIEDSLSILGVRSEVLIGTLELFPEERLSINEAKRRVKLFLNRKVK